MGTFAIVRSFLISVISIQFAFQPLAFAKEQSQFQADLAKKIERLQKGKKNLTFGEFYRSIEGQLPVSISEELRELAQVYGKEKMPTIQVISGKGPSDQISVLIENGKKESIKVDISSNPNSVMRMNGQNFAVADFVNMKSFAKKYLSAFPKETAASDRVANLAGRQMTLTYKQFKSLDVEQQGKYLVHLRKMLMAAEVVLKNKNKATAKATSSANEFWAQMFFGVEAFATADRNCVVAGNPTIYGKNDQGKDSCGGKVGEVVHPSRLACGPNNVQCNTKLFKDPSNGGNICIEKEANFLSATKICDEKNPVQTKEQQKALAKALGADYMKNELKTEADIDRFNKEYKEALYEAINSCGAPGGSDPKQGEACDVLKAREFTLDYSDIDAAPIIAPTDADPKPIAKKDDNSMMWKILGGILLAGLVVGILCLTKIICPDSQKPAFQNANASPSPTPTPNPDPDPVPAGPDSGKGVGGAAAAGRKIPQGDGSN